MYATLSKWLLTGWATVGLLYAIHVLIPHAELYFN